MKRCPFGRDHVDDSGAAAAASVYKQSVADMGNVEAGMMMVIITTIIVLADDDDHRHPRMVVDSGLRCERDTHIY